jgi:sugar phosphate isomerase/epimerase
MCDRGGSLGVRTVVLGSGQARNVPPGFSPEVARGQFLDFVTAAARHCAAREQRLTLEPLNSTETNFVNSCAQARPVVDELAGVRIAVDCYHVVSEGLSVSAEVAAAAGAIGHAHTSSLPRGTGDFQPAVQAEFVAELRAAGHTGGLTIEDAFTDFGREAADAALLFRRILTAEAVRS